MACAALQVWMSAARTMAARNSSLFRYVPPAVLSVVASYSCSRHGSCIANFLTQSRMHHRHSHLPPDARTSVVSSPAPSASSPPRSSGPSAAGWQRRHRSAACHEAEACSAANMCAVAEVSLQKAATSGTCVGAHAHHSGSKTMHAIAPSELCPPSVTPSSLARRRPGA